jgi:hypothetical protein
MRSSQQTGTGITPYRSEQEYDSLLQPSRRGKIMSGEKLTVDITLGSSLLEQIQDTESGISDDGRADEG